MTNRVLFGPIQCKSYLRCWIWFRSRTRSSWSWSLCPTSERISSASWRIIFSWSRWTLSFVRLAFFTSSVPLLALSVSVLSAADVFWLLSPSIISAEAEADEVLGQGGESRETWMIRANRDRLTMKHRRTKRRTSTKYWRSNFIRQPFCCGSKRSRWRRCCCGYCYCRRYCFNGTAAVVSDSVVIVSRMLLFPSKYCFRWWRSAVVILAIVSVVLTVNSLHVHVYIYRFSWSTIHAPDITIIVYEHRTLFTSTLLLSLQTQGIDGLQPLSWPTTVTNPIPNRNAYPQSNFIEYLEFAIRWVLLGQNPFASTRLSVAKLYRLV